MEGGLTTQEVMRNYQLPLAVNAYQPGMSAGSRLHGGDPETFRPPGRILCLVQSR
jgi:hypothetical protein